MFALCIEKTTQSLASRRLFGNGILPLLHQEVELFPSFSIWAALVWLGPVKCGGNVCRVCHAWSHGFPRLPLFCWLCLFFEASRHAEVWLLRELHLPLRKPPVYLWKTPSLNEQKNHLANLAQSSCTADCEQNPLRATIQPQDSVTSYPPCSPLTDGLHFSWGPPFPQPIRAGTLQSLDKKSHSLWFSALSFMDCFLWPSYGKSNNGICSQDAVCPRSMHSLLISVTSRFEPRCFDEGKPPTFPVVALPHQHLWPLPLLFGSTHGLPLL